jgi:Protein of unknown function (DUF1573)
MKFCKTISALVIVMLAAFSSAAQQKQTPVQPDGGSAPSGAAPILTIDSFTHDFGEVKPGDPLRFAFKVKNIGKADLVINNVAPG